ncbi:VOC family protein [Solihabitans fulvus]|uniref:VOC family protein n=1 Tax=Solihabitans fulvus TaxID=1892852 RepID=A0A5B2XIZ6_9PSEU|nr:VOC family protein [Solihabitans fulvus]KAA2263383.1 VOC family protein [Solihabitans fulvus]
MTTTWGLTVDCARPKELAKFWAVALGYVEPPPPAGFASWPDWFAEFDVPEDEWDDAAYLADPAGVGPTLSFLKVPESKVVKNRLHLDLKVGGGRQTPWEDRWPRVLAAAERLTAIGARVVSEEGLAGQPDHLVLADPEGNEFCLV